MGSGTFYPAVSGDDGYGFLPSGSFDNATTTLYIGNSSGTSGLSLFVRFLSINIPQGATITSAFVKFFCETSTSDTTCNVNCYFNNEDNAIAPTDISEFNGLSLTNAVAWNDLGAWIDGTQYDTPNLVSILQNIVDRGGWVENNAIQIIIKDNSSSFNALRQPSSWEKLEGGEKAELHVTWSDDKEITLPSPFFLASSLLSNIQVELVPGALSAETSMSTGEPFWGTFFELPSPFAVSSSLQAKTGLEIAVAPLIAQTNLQSNVQIELVPPVFEAQNELSVGEVWAGVIVALLNPFSVSVSLQANSQIELVVPPLLATSELLSNIGIEVSAGSLLSTGSISAIIADIFSVAILPRVYTFTLTGAADGVDDIVIPIKSFQSRLKSGDPTYLSVVIPGIDYASAINLRLNGDIIVRMGYLSGGEIILSEIISMVNFENIIIYDGTTNKTITLDGHRTETFIPKEINLTGSSYKNLTAGKLRYRCTPNLYVRPGDTANIDDDSFTIENITYSVSPELETFEVSE